MPTLSTSFQHTLEVIAIAIREEEEVKRIQIRKEEVTLSLLANDLILYIENPRDATRKLLEIINEFSKVAGYKIKRQKSLAFLYSNNKKLKKRISENNHIYHCIKKNKIPRNKPTQEAKDLYAENYDTNERNPT